MKNHELFRPAGRTGFYKLELVLHVSVVRALKRLYGMSRRKSLRELCEDALCVYADTVYQGKSFAQFRRDAGRPCPKPAFAPVRDERQLLAEEMADAMARGVFDQKQYPRQFLSAAIAHELIKQRPAWSARSWTYKVNKPSGGAQRTARRSPPRRKSPA